jgi:probable HAF family extracellular repeat protein
MRRSLRLLCLPFLLACTDTSGPTGLLDDAELRAAAMGPAAHAVEQTRLENLGLASEAEAINNAGFIVGWGTPLVDENIQGFVWDPRTRSARFLPFPIGDDPIGGDSWARDINERGEIAGTLHASGQHPRAVVWNLGSWSIRELGTLGGEMSQAWGINSRGQVVGVSQISSGEERAFFWEPSTGTMHNLGTFGGRSWADAINDRGEIAGFSRLPSGEDRAFFWSPRIRTLQPLGTLGGPESVAHGINNRGQVVGRSDISASQYHAFVWDASGGMRDLGTLGGGFSAALGINNRGQVIGWSSTAAGAIRAFVWDPVTDAMRELGPLDGRAYGISDSGDIVGFSESSSLPPGATLWTISAGPPK